jgi:Kef-type K+ transport system membrane component KefB
MVGAMLSVTAFPVMARILQEKGLTQSAMGSIGIAAAAVVTVLMFLVVSISAGVKSGISPAELALKVVYALAYVGVLFFVVRPALKSLGRMYEARGLTMDIFAIILIMLFVSSFIANRLEINVIVGSFLLGAILPARLGLYSDLSRRLSDLTAVILLPIFLAFSGLQTDFTTLRPEHLVGIVLFLVAGIVSKWGGGAVSARLGGLSWAEGNLLGVLMNCRGLLVLVVGLVAFNLQVISPQMQVAGVLMALITTAMTGPLFDTFSRRLPAEPAPTEPTLVERPATGAVSG